MPRYYRPNVFRGTWASRPSPSTVPVGSEFIATDYANQKWVNDGTYWRPAQGRALLKMLCAPLATPLAIFTGGTAGLFTLPGGPVKIPAELIPQNSKIVVSASYRRTTAVVALNTLIYLGTTATNSDVGILSQSIAATVNQDAVACGAARFGSSKTTLTTSNWISDYNTASAATVASDRSININTDADMYVTLGISGANVADSVALISVSVHLEA